MSMPSISQEAESEESADLNGYRRVTPVLERLRPAIRTRTIAGAVSSPCRGPVDSTPVDAVCAPPGECDRFAALRRNRTSARERHAPPGRVVIVGAKSGHDPGPARPDSRREPRPVAHFAFFAISRCAAARARLVVGRRLRVRDLARDVSRVRWRCQLPCPRFPKARTRNPHEKSQASQSPSRRWPPETRATPSRRAARPAGELRRSSGSLRSRRGGRPDRRWPCGRGPRRRSGDRRRRR